MREKLKLGVNIDHVASLRQARGTVYPSVLDAAKICEDAGAHGITIHLREDRRHIQDADVTALKRAIRTRMNLELANTDEIVGIALEVKPDEVCMVPEKREELTTEGGLNILADKESIARSVAKFRDAGIIVSMFVDPDSEQIKASADIGAEYIELHTGTYCELAGDAQARELDALIAGAELANELGLKVNAGHGLNMSNLAGMMSIPHLDTLNIGHSIIARSVFVGLCAAVKEILEGMQAYESS